MRCTTIAFLALAPFLAEGLSPIASSRASSLTRSRLHAKGQPELRFRGGSLANAEPESRVSVARPAGRPFKMLDFIRGGGMGKAGVDITLMLYFAFWYLGNYYYTLNNKLALNAAGGATGYPMSVAYAQLTISLLYALFLWVAPDARSFPKITMQDFIDLIPVGFCVMGAHASSVFSMSAGAVSFAQIVKASEPAFAAVLGVTLYGKSVSKGKWLCLIPVIGGVVLASVKELDFAWSALFTAAIANTFAAFRSNENKKVMETPGLKDRIGIVGNQYALSVVIAWLTMTPLYLLTEAKKFGAFKELFFSNKDLRINTLTSGLYFYLYNELSTMTIKKISATAQSVANTAKRVIVIVGTAIVLGESLDPIKMLGCAIGIAGVFAYSMVP